MKISTKLYALVSSLLLLAATLGIFGLWGMNDTLKGLDAVYQDRVVPLRDLKVIADEYAVAVVDAVHKVRDGQQNAEEAGRRMREAQQAISENWQTYLSTTLVPAETEIIAEARPLMQRADDLIERMAADLEQGITRNLNQIAAFELYQAIDPISDAIADLIEVQLDVAREVYDEQRATYQRIQAFVIGAILLGGLIGLGASIWLIRKTVVDPLEDARRFAGEIAGANLGTDIAIPRRDEVGLLALSLREMRDALRSMVELINSKAQQISVSSEQLSTSSEQISEASGEQSQAASAMAAAVEQMTVSINHVSEFAQDARSLAQTSGESSREGSVVIEAVVSDIQRTAESVTKASGEVRELGEYSREIATVVSVIKDVADQTNLLALNAAIEAARAGEQGRGFAVVADEVRKLAERTALSTEQIAGIVDKIMAGTERVVESMDAQVEQVASGVELAGRAGAVIGEINAASEKVVAAVEEISGALREQSSASNEVSRNVERIATMGEENHGAVSESALAARNLAGLATQLKQTVSQFRL